MNERDLFEEWFSKAKYHKHLKENFWDVWQASANRQGYKLVPIEPTDEMLEAQDYIRDVSAIEIYKAMIGAVGN